MRLYDYDASANCYKVRLLLALLGTPYERVPIDIFAGDTLTDEYRALNALRETPVLELDSGETIAQSNAILWYLAESTPYLPDSRLQRALVAQWLFFEQERVMSGIGSARFRTMTGRDPALAAARFAVGEGALAVLEEHLAHRSFLVGERCSIADISVFAYTHVAVDAGYDLARYQAVAAWLGRVRAQPGFVDDLAPYPANARAGASRSIYD
ncbi:MAG: glutathione S-transferase family protein [Gaiellaceae bacterium]